MWQQTIIAISILILPFLYNGKAAIPEFASLCFIGTVAAILLLPKIQKSIRFSLPDLLVVLFFLWMGIGIIRSNSIFPSALLKWAALLLSYLLFRLWKPGKIVWIAIFVSGILQAIEGENNFSNSGLRAGYLALAFLCGLGLLLATKLRKHRLTLIIGMLIIGYSLVLSDSRSAWCAVIAGILTATILKSRTSFPAWLNNNKKTFFFIILAIALLGILLYHYKPDSANGRLFIWKIGLQMASQHPICGGGYEYFIRNYMYAQANYFHAHPHAHEIMLADNTRYAFNEGLHLLCNWGIIGCFLMAALLCSLCRNLKSAANLIPASMLAGLLVFSCFSYPSSRLSLSMFYLLLTASIVNNSSQQTGYTFTLPPTTQWGMRIFAMFGIIATTFLYSECRQANDLWHALRQKQTTPQELIAQTPYFIHEPEFQSRIGKACIQQKYYPETIRLLEKSAHLRPTVEMLCDLGTAYRKTGDKQKAEQCFQTAIDMIPSRMLARYRLFCLYRDNGETQKAQQTAQEILTQKAKVVNSVTLNIKQEARKYYEHINP